MITKTDDFESYLTDASNMQGGHASKLFIPESVEEIQAILKEANAQSIPVTVSGARTGTVGGAVPFGGFIISTERLNKIKSIDREARTAVVEPGVILRDFQKAVEAEGLFYPPDPTEWSCQIGGTVATNASGSRSFKYGATRRYVDKLKVVLADGEVLRLSRGDERELKTESGKPISFKFPTYSRPNVRKNVSGYFSESDMDPIDLFIGSEGTLGTIAEIELTLLQKPEGFFSGIVFFEKESDLLTFVDAAKTASFISQNGPLADDGPMAIDASLIEYFDDQALKFIAAKFPETPSNMAGAVFFEHSDVNMSEI